ncbi:preprotein translocase subunit YajC [Alteriqipengyuania sp. 357]
MTRLPVVAALLAGGALLPAPALAQYWGDDEVTSSGSTSQQGQAPSGYPAQGDGYGDGYGEASGDGARPTGAPVRQRLQIDPYIEAAQVYTREISPGGDDAAYAQVAAGVDASVQGRRGGGSVSLRYDRVISYGDDQADADAVTGIARGYAALAPGLQVEAGGLAARTRTNGGGAAIASGQPIDPDNEARIYSAYAGPTYSSRVGAADVSASYRFGYNRVEEPAVGAVDNTLTPIDVAQETYVHSANARVGVAPGRVLPVGMAVGGGAYQEEISNSDQRVRDFYARGDVTVPVGPTLAVVGGAGYEYVEISNRDVVRDADGDPVVGSDGRFQTDENSPRRIAFETEGLIWDVGVVWKPSRRTQLEAHYGRRYDSDTYYGTFSWQPSSRTSINASVYDSVSGFGGAITNGLANLPSGFLASRNGLTGDFTGCVSGTDADGSTGCLGGALSSIRGAAFRNRGGQIAFSNQRGRISTGLALGYDRRTFFGAEGTALAAANGVVDESYYGNASLGVALDSLSALSVNGYASYYDPSGAELSDALLLGVSAAYSRTLFRSLSARAAVSLDAIDSDTVDQSNASALLGLRYDF